MNEQTEYTLMDCCFTLTRMSVSGIFDGCSKFVVFPGDLESHSYVETHLTKASWKNSITLIGKEGSLNAVKIVEINRKKKEVQ